VKIQLAVLEACSLLDETINSICSVEYRLPVNKDEHMRIHYAIMLENMRSNCRTIQRELKELVSEHPDA